MRTSSPGHETRTRPFLPDRLRNYILKPCLIIRTLHHGRYRASDDERTLCAIITRGTLNTVTRADVKRGSTCYRTFACAVFFFFFATCSVMSLSHGRHILFSNSISRLGWDPVTNTCFFHAQFTWEVRLGHLDSRVNSEECDKRANDCATSDGLVTDHKPGEPCQVDAALSHSRYYLSHEVIKIKQLLSSTVKIK